METEIINFSHRSENSEEKMSSSYNLTNYNTKFEMHKMNTMPPQRIDSELARHKILIVDDIDFNLEALKILLKIQGLSDQPNICDQRKIIHTSQSGSQALE